MGPDIEWQITDETEQPTIIKTPTSKPPRWRALAVALIVALGVGLGIVYRSVPEPPLRPPDTPTPTATPAAMPPALFQAIDHEAQALADGDNAAFANGLDSGSNPLSRFQRYSFRAWGRPAGDSLSLYNILDFQQRTPDSAAVDVRQYRDGRYFRETRFYRLHNGRWLRSGPDPLYWSGTQENSDTPHFHATYPVEDRDLALPVIQQLEQAYSRLCRDLDCAATPECPTSPGSLGCNPIQHEITFTLLFSSNASPMNFPAASELNEIHLPSPRVMGVFEQSDPISPENSNNPWFLAQLRADPLGPEVGNNLWFLAQLMAQRIAYGSTGSPYRDGAVILRAIGMWASNRAVPFPSNNRFGAFNFNPDTQQLLPLEALWSRTDASNARQKSREAYAVIRFVEQTYGPPAVAKLLGALGKAQSFADAIQTGLGVRAVVFEQKWEAWIKQLAASQG